MFINLKGGWSLANRCFLGLVEEETIDHILLHYVKARVLWQLLFEVPWVLPLTVKETLLGWHDSFVGKKHKKAWKASLICIFWTIWKERNRIAFDNKELSIQRPKISFVCTLWAWTKLCIDEGPLLLINFFFYWSCSRWGQVVFFVTPLFCRFFYLAIIAYLLYTLGRPLGVLSFLFNIIFFTDKK